MKKYWLWTWRHGRDKTRSGWDFETKQEAQAFFNRHFKDQHLSHEITVENQHSNPSKRRKLHTGPRGGKYYIRHGRKVYR